MKNEFDKLFRDKLKDKEVPFNVKAWEEMSGSLGAINKPTRFWPFIKSSKFLLLLSMGIGIIVAIIAVSSENKINHLPKVIDTKISLNEKPSDNNSENIKDADINTTGKRDDNSLNTSSNNETTIAEEEKVSTDKLKTIENQTSILKPSNNSTNLFPEPLNNASDIIKSSPNLAPEKYKEVSHESSIINGGLAPGNSKKDNNYFNEKKSSDSIKDEKIIANVGNSEKGEMQNNVTPSTDNKNINDESSELLSTNLTSLEKSEVLNNANKSALQVGEDKLIKNEELRPLLMSLPYIQSTSIVLDKKPLFVVPVLSEQYLSSIQPIKPESTKVLALTGSIYNSKERYLGLELRRSITPSIELYGGIGYNYLPGSSAVIGQDSIVTFDFGANISTRKFSEDGLHRVSFPIGVSLIINKLLINSGFRVNKLIGVKSEINSINETSSAKMSVWVENLGQNDLTLDATLGVGYQFSRKVRINGRISHLLKKRFNASYFTNNRLSLPTENNTSFSLKISYDIFK